MRMGRQVDVWERAEPRRGRAPAYALSAALLDALRFREEAREAQQEAPGPATFLARSAPQPKTRGRGEPKGSGRDTHLRPEPGPRARSPPVAPPRLPGRSLAGFVLASPRAHVHRDPRCVDTRASPTGARQDARQRASAACLRARSLPAPAAPHGQSAGATSPRPSLRPDAAGQARSRLRAAKPPCTDRCPAGHPLWDARSPRDSPRRHASSSAKDASSAPQPMVPAPGPSSSSVRSPAGRRGAAKAKQLRPRPFCRAPPRPGVAPPASPRGPQRRTRGSSDVREIRPSAPRGAAACLPACLRPGSAAGALRELAGCPQR